MRQRTLALLEWRWEQVDHDRRALRHLLNPNVQRAIGASTWQWLPLAISVVCVPVYVCRTAERVGLDVAIAVVRGEV